MAAPMCSHIHASGVQSMKPASACSPKKQKKSSRSRRRAAFKATVRGRGSVTHSRPWRAAHPAAP